MGGTNGGTAGTARPAAGARAGAGGFVPVPRAQVLVTVPVLALLGATDEPAVLDGYGPIPPSMARRLIADGAGSFHRVLTDPRDGAPLEIGRTSYRLTTAQRHWLRLRDGRCPFPAAPTTPWTTRQTTSWPGPTAAPPASRTSASPARNTTGLNTPPGHRPGPAQTTRRAGPHRPDATIPANTRTGNRPTGPKPGCPHPGHGRPRPGTRPRHRPRSRPARGSGPSLPPDPFPDWHQFTEDIHCPRRTQMIRTGQQPRPTPIRNGSCSNVPDRLCLTEQLRSSVNAVWSLIVKAVRLHHRSCRGSRRAPRHRRCSSRDRRRRGLPDGLRMARRPRVDGSSTGEKLPETLGAPSAFS
nr:DUF222 domain-containing protein [Arthrobacter sp. NicSoilC12]